jgi:molybdate transport system permease protein
VTVNRPWTGGVSGPVALTVPALLGLAFLVGPLVGLLVRTPWLRLPGLLADPAVAEALRLSLVASGIATVLCVLLGVPLAWLLAQPGLPGRSLLRALVTVPLVMPPVVGGVALLMLLGRNGVLGAPLAALTGITIPFTATAVVLAETFVALPFLVLSVEGALRSADRRYEDAAATLGADRLTVFRRVTVPLVLPGIASGAVLSWARALGEFGATVTFAGSFPGRTQTMPVAVYLALESNPDAALALSVILLLVSVLLLGLLRDRWISR